MSMKLHFYVHSKEYVFTKECPKGVKPLAYFREEEGESYVLEYSIAIEQGIPYTFPCSCLQIKEKTALNAVGITVRVAEILASKDIPCNVIAAYYHDYFFVPNHMGKQALLLLNGGF